MPKEGDIGTTPDGKKVIYMDGAARIMNEGGLAIMGGGYFKAPNGQTYRQGPQGGFSQIAGPSTTQVDKYAEKSSLVNEALTSLDAFDKQFRKTKVTGPGGWFTNPNDLAELQQLSNDLMLRLKEKPYNLGVLNGPDLAILETIVANPASIKDAALRKSVLPRLRNIAASLGSTYRNDMSSFGATGGRRAVMPNIYRAKDSSYTAEEWGTDGVVPANRYGGKAGARPTGAPARPGAAAPTAKEFSYDAQGRRVR